MPAKPSERLRETFKRQYTKALSRLSQAVSDNYPYLIQNAASAKEAWNNLERHFENRGYGELRRRKRDLLTVRMDDREKKRTEKARVEQHLAGMRTMASRLAGMGQIITEAEYVDAVLSSLPERYRVAVTTIAAQPDADLNEDYVTSIRSK